MGNGILCTLFCNWKDGDNYRADNCIKYTIVMVIMVLVYFGDGVVGDVIDVVVVVVVVVAMFCC